MNKGHKVCPYLENKGSAVRFCLWPPMLKKTKYLINYLISKFFRLFPNNSLLINSYKAFTIQDKLHLRIPYTNLKLINFLKDYSKDKTKLSIFEYGSGSSTLFFEDYFDEVFSVEHDKEWFEIISKSIKKANVYFVPPKKTPNPIYGSKRLGFKNLDFFNYVNFIDSLENKFDVIFIDGRVRQECLKLAKHYIKSGGIIILDDSNRSRYKKIFLKESLNKETVHFGGLGTFIPSIHKSSLIIF